MKLTMPGDINVDGVALIRNFRMNEVNGQFRIKSEIFWGGEWKDTDVAIMEIKFGLPSFELVGIDMVRQTAFNLKVSLDVLKRSISITGKFNNQKINIVGLRHVSELVKAVISIIKS